MRNLDGVGGLPDLGQEEPQAQSEELSGLGPGAEGARVKPPAPCPRLPGDGEKPNCGGKTTAQLIGWSAGARTVGTGGESTPFGVGLNPAPMVTFPAPPLKFRTAGFPQYGLKLGVWPSASAFLNGRRLGARLPHEASARQFAHAFACSAGFRAFDAVR
jgi:hypothetical protein